MTDEYVNKQYLSYWFVAICSAALFLMITWMVSVGETAEIDFLIQNKITHAATPVVRDGMIMVSLAGHPAVLFSISLAFSYIFIFQKKFLNAIILDFGVGGIIIVQYLAKLLFVRERPVGSLYKGLGYSFPSGHAATAMAFFFLMIWLVFRKNAFLPGRLVIALIGLCLALLIGFSRIYLNLHWTSDVAAGFALGFFWPAFVILSVYSCSDNWFLKNANQTASR